MCQSAYEVAFGVYSGVLPRTIEHQAVTARSSFRMTLDAKPYCNPEPTPLMIQTAGLVSQESSKEEDTSEQREMDLLLYADYEPEDRSHALGALRETAQNMGDRIERQIQPRQQTRAQSNKRQFARR